MFGMARDAILTWVLVAGPRKLIGLAVGIALSLFQALTQIQEMTLHPLDAHRHLQAVVEFIASVMRLNRRVAERRQAIAGSRPRRRDSSCANYRRDSFYANPLREQRV